MELKGFPKLKTKLDKGHKTQFRQIVEMIKQGSVQLIPYDELINATKASLAAIESLKKLLGYQLIELKKMIKELEKIHDIVTNMGIVYVFLEFLMK